MTSIDELMEAQEELLHEYFENQERDKIPAIIVVKGLRMAEKARLIYEIKNYSQLDGTFDVCELGLIMRVSSNRNILFTDNSIICDEYIKRQLMEKNNDCAPISVVISFANRNATRIEKMYPLFCPVLSIGESRPMSNIDIRTKPSPYQPFLIEIIEVLKDVSDYTDILQNLMWIIMIVVKGPGYLKEAGKWIVEKIEQKRKKKSQPKDDEPLN